MDLVKVDFWIDHGPISGMGHFSRCRGLLEFLVWNCGIKVDIHGADHGLRSQLKWVRDLGCSPKNLEPSEFDSNIILVDTYSINIYTKILQLENKKIVAIFDSNNTIVKAQPNMLIVRLENLKSISENSKQINNQLKPEITGTLFWNSVLENSFLEKSAKLFRVRSRKKKIVVALGGSLMVQEVLEKICLNLSLLSDTTPIVVDVFLNKQIISKIKDITNSLDFINLYEFTDDYYNKLIESDLLICGSGTSAIEAYHLSIKSIILPIFTNAISNFNGLQRIYKNAIYIDTKKFLDFTTFKNSIITMLNCGENYAPSKNGAIDCSRLRRIQDFISSEIR